MDNLPNHTDETELYPDLYHIMETTQSPGLAASLKKMDLGRPVDYTLEIGAFICNLISEGKTIQNVIDAYNGTDPVTKLTKTKIYSWLKNNKLKTFHEWYYYAREVSTNGILDDIIQLEDDIISDTVSFKSGRVALESKRWRAKVQNPDYFNPVQKTEEDHKHEIIIKASIPGPLPLPAQYQVGDTSHESEIVDAEAMVAGEGDDGPTVLG
jgi:hypothetical protein